MKLRFKHLTIDNFLSIGHGEIDLDDRGYVLIEGHNHNPLDNAISNGSGKSSCVSAISYCLTGETIGGVSSNLKNIYTEGDLKVSLSFDMDGKAFVVTRTRDNKGKPNLKIVIDGEDKSGKTLRESEEQLKKYLPDLTSELLGEVILIGQGMPHRFSNNTPSGRKEILEKLSNNDLMLEDIKGRVEKRLTALNDQKEKLDKERVRVETELSMYETQKKRQEEKLKGLEENLGIDYEKEIESKKEALDTLNKGVEELNSKYAKAEGELSELQRQLSSVLEEKGKEIEEERKVFDQHHEPILQKIYEKRAQLNSLSRDIETKEKITDVCPTCGQKLIGVHKPDLTADYKKREELKEEVSRLEQKSKSQEESFRLNKEDISKDYDDRANTLQNAQIKPLESEKSTLWTNIRRKQEEARRASLELARLTSENDGLNERIREAKESLSTLDKTIAEAKETSLYNIKEIDNLRNHLDAVSKMNTYVKRDFRGILLSNVISYIEGKCKEYSKEIFGNDDIEFALNGNNIDIKKSGRLLDTLSGGERQKVDLIIQFSIRSMMEEYTNFSSNVIFLDEILDNLDSAGCDQVLNFITNRLSNIESVFIISHHSDSLNISCDSKIVVTKDSKGVSAISEG